MNDEQIGSVEAEARRLTEALARAGGGDGSGGDLPDGEVTPPATGDDEHPADGRPPLRLVVGSGDAGVECDCGDPDPPCARCHGLGWTRTHAPDVLRSLADVSMLLADGLRTLASAIDETRARHDATEDPDGGGTVPRPGTTDERRQEQA